MNALSFTHSSGARVRTAGTPDAPVFIGKDICELLGYSKYRDALAALDADERVSIETDTLGGKQEMTGVTESGFYSLVLGSRKPEAREIKRWVTHDVLPSIRKTGAYLVTTDTPQNKFAVMRQMLDQLEAQEARLQQNEWAVARLDARIDLFGADTDYRTVRAFAKDQGRKIPENAAREIGKRVAELCRQRGITIGNVPDEKYGRVHSYPASVIEEVLGLPSRSLK